MESGQREHSEPPEVSTIQEQHGTDLVQSGGQELLRGQLKAMMKNEGQRWIVGMPY